MKMRKWIWTLLFADNICIRFSHAGSPNEMISCNYSVKISKGPISQKLDVEYEVGKRKHGG